MSLHIVYGPPMSGKTVNAKGIMKLLSCDAVFDWQEQLCIIRSIERGLNVLVLSHEKNPPVFKGSGLSGLFDGATATSIEIIRHVMADEWKRESGRDVESGTKFQIIRQVSLFHHGWNFSEPVRNGRSIAKFNSRKEAEGWIKDHQFVKDHHDVIRSVNYKVKPFFNTDPITSK